MNIDYLDFLRDLLIDVVATYVFVFLIYYRRHGDRDMAVTLGLFNAFLFTIVIALTLTEINMGAGFALFAVLSIISLRSVNIAKIEVGYLFGVIALALINGISFPDYTLLALANLVIVGSAFVLDSPWLVRPTLEVDLTLDNITVAEVMDKPGLTTRIATLYQLPVQHLRIQKYNPEKATLRVTARLRLK